MSTEDNSTTAIEKTIPSTSEIIQKAQEQQQVPTTDNSGYSKRVVEWVSQENCGACVKQEEFFNNVLKPQSDIPVEITKVDVKSERGQQIADEHNLKYTPFYKECLIPKDPTKQPECREGNKYDPNEWKIKVNESNSTQQ